MFHHNVAGTSGDCPGKHLKNYERNAAPVGHLLYREGFRLVLHGHRHQPFPAAPPAPGAQLPYVLGCGAFWTEGTDPEETAGYTVLSFTASGETRLAMRRFYPQNPYRVGHWGVDNLIAQDGTLYLGEELWR